MANANAVRRYDTEAVLAQIASTLRQIATDLAADPDENRPRAWMRASSGGKLRRSADQETRDISHLADLFVHWLVERVDRETLEASLPVALAAAEDPHGTSLLSRDLTEYVTGYCDGSMSDDEWYRRLKKPRGAGRPRRGLRRKTLPPGQYR